MTTKVRFLGVAGYEIEGPEHRILIDPYLTGNPSAPVTPETIDRPDVILVSHAAFDHLGDTASIAARTGAPVVCGADVRTLLLEGGIPSDQVRATVWGIVVKVGGVVVRPVECHHWSLARLSNGTSVAGVPMGFIVETEPGVRIYHYGDTAIFDGLRLIGQLYHPTVGFLGCTQPQLLLQQIEGAGEVLSGELSPREAALAAEFLGLKLAIASHYLDLEDRQGVEAREVAEFLTVVKELDTTGTRDAVAPSVGETLTLNGSSLGRERQW
jgi:L-ascorbate metabolism protein UlaG (beta-lactamase superfamily)